MRVDQPTDYPQSGDLTRVAIPRPELPKKGTLVVRFLEKVKIEPGGCWLWQAEMDASGYPRFRHPETKWAHRAAYLLFVGPIPAGLSIDHLCYTPACVRPDHLDPVPQGRNKQRATGGWSECDRLHPDSPTRQRQKPNGRVMCAECHRVREAERRSRKKSAVNAPRLPHESLDSEVQ